MMPASTQTTKEPDANDPVANDPGNSSRSAKGDARSVPRTHRIRAAEIVIFAGIGMAMLFASAFRLWPITVTEVLGFVTGGACVWLTARESVWNWPIGLANNVLFFALFYWGRLFADMSLQVVYFALGIYGWRHWLRGGTGGTVLRISRATRAEWVSLLGFVIAGTFGIRAILIAVQGAAPFLDALTTVLSLAAQYLLCRKRVEHWFFWIAADLIYIPLYWTRDLQLTAVLYAVFLAMCIYGLRGWQRRMGGMRERHSP